MEGHARGRSPFLEHKMFDTPDGNALNILSANGASPNAFTSQSMTAYHFESTQGIRGQSAHTFELRVRSLFHGRERPKEQGIIGQEIRMMEDHPGYAVYMNLMKSSMRINPSGFRGGTLQSIAK
jgi:predicted Zn-dependent peptidase